MEGFQASRISAPSVKYSTDGFFKCSESPITLTEEQLNEVKRLQTSSDTYRVSAFISGTETMSVVPDGLSIAGSTSNVFIANTVNHNWIETRLVVPGAHAVIKKKDVDSLVKGNAEIQIYFKSEKRATDIKCICIPILVGNGRGKEYFATLGSIQRNRPSFTSLWAESTEFVLYTAKDLRNRSTVSCATDANKVQYLVATQPAFININDLARLKSNLTKANGYVSGPPNTQSVSTKLSLISYIPSIQIASKTSSETRKVANGYVETAQVKCRPLDQKRDISGNLIYVGGKELRGDTSLDKELEAAADFSNGFKEPTGTIQGSDIETILGIVLGVVVGIVVIAFLVVWVFRTTETNYMTSLKHYSSAGYEKTLTIVENTWKKLIPEPCKKVAKKAVEQALAQKPLA